MNEHVLSIRPSLFAVSFIKMFGSDSHSVDFSQERQKNPHQPHSSNTHIPLAFVSYFYACCIAHFSFTSFILSSSPSTTEYQLMTEHRTKKNRMPSQRRRLLSPTILALATTAACLLATTPSTVSAFGNNNHKKVLLKDVQTLTLHQGRMTTGRRTSPVPQIKCVGGNACGDFEPGNFSFSVLLETASPFHFVSINRFFPPLFLILLQWPSIRGGAVYECRIRWERRAMEMSGRSTRQLAVRTVGCLL